MVNELTIGVPSDKRSVLRRLEDLLPQIEDGLARGYSHAVMHAALPQLGINISLPYYHRVLHKLRKERREGRQAPTLPKLLPALGQLPQAKAEVPACDVKTTELSSAFIKGAPGQSSTISGGSGETQMFKYRGEALLNRDFTKF